MRKKAHVNDRHNKYPQENLSNNDISVLFIKNDSFIKQLLYISLLFSPGNYTLQNQIPQSK